MSDYPTYFDEIPNDILTEILLNIDRDNYRGISYNDYYCIYLSDTSISPILTTQKFSKKFTILLYYILLQLQNSQTSIINLS